jgi:hypothetical protein
VTYAAWTYGDISAARRTDTVMRAEAAAVGRDPAALACTRWGQIDMTADYVQGRASQGVNRLVVSPGSTELAGMQAEVSSFAHRLGLG